MSKNSEKYFLKIRSKALKLERSTINGDEKIGFFNKNSRRIICVSIALSFLPFIPNGFDKEFINLTATILSIFIGLFITALIFAFDKFYTPQSATESSSTASVKDKQSYNFFKIFTYLVGFNILISILVLTLLLCNSIFFDLLSFKVEFIQLNFEELNFVQVKLMCKISLILCFRFLTLYNLFSIFYITVFMVSNMVEYLWSNIDYEKRNKKK